MSDVISFVTSLLFIACLLYVPICAIVVLARSLATPGEGKMTKEDERFGKLFSWHYLFWAVYALLILFCIGSADCHPVHDGMTEAESKILCWKALLAGSAMCSEAVRGSSRCRVCCLSLAFPADCRCAGGIQEMEACAL